MPLRPMSEKESAENEKLIAKIKKEIERMEGILAGYEAQQKEGVWYSGDLSGRKEK